MLRQDLPVVIVGEVQQLLARQQADLAALLRRERFDAAVKTGLALVKKDLLREAWGLMHDFDAEGDAALEAERQKNLGMLQQFAGERLTGLALAAKTAHDANDRQSFDESAVINQSANHRVYAKRDRELPKKLQSTT